MDRQAHFVGMSGSVRDIRGQTALLGRQGSRWIFIWLVVGLALQMVAYTAIASFRVAEGVALRATGLLDTIICHTGPEDAAQLAGERTDEQPRPIPSHGLSCDCCIAGCGHAGAAGVTIDRATVRPVRQATTTADFSALDAGHLRTYLKERVHAPRSPPPAV